MSYTVRYEAHVTGKTVFGRSYVTEDGTKPNSVNNVPDKIRNYCIKLRQSEQVKTREKKRYEMELIESFDEKNKKFRQVIS